MEKYGNSKSWSKEMEVDDGSTDKESDSENDNTGVGRTYECNYCKRGFTNAQALGGHMNIHRKDKAKAKARQQQQQQQAYTNNNFSSSSSISFKSTAMEPVSPYSSSSLVPFRQGYYPFPSNPNIFSSHPNHNHFINRRTTRLFGMYEDQLGADLSLRISSTNIDQYHQQQLKEKNKKKEDIDLELRLGYDP
ncbi:zinc finger protein 11-like [Chenopodium quinoa]|uniref:zinc finger protein 11-like n=1 Tax=Chenopodium quinoa TaxID=63459 RepID=UPI000B76F6BC|nr:zinc finger protein 11-like [Chenopodium quinoa]